MSYLLAILAIAGLYAVLSGPLLLAAWRSAATLPLACGYAVLLTLTTGYHSGLFASTTLPKDLPRASAVGVSAAQCMEVLSLLDQSGAIVERSRPPRLVVVGDRWSQLPEEAQQVVLDCVARGWPAGSGPPQVEVRSR